MKISKLLMAAFAALLVSSCSDNDEPAAGGLSQKEQTLKTATEAYVEHTVRPTYSAMADAAIRMRDLCNTIQEKHAAGTLASGDIKAAGEAWKEARKTYWNYLDELDAAILEIAGMTKDEIYDGIEKIQNTITYQIPWFTSSIQGVLGTEPLQYSIVSVKNESAENAALFNESLSIVGGGRMYVAYDVKAPVGVYTVSIKVENEGQSAVLEDIFTFVIETAEDATEGE